METEEGAACNVFSEPDVIQGCLSCSTTGEYGDTQLLKGVEDVGVLTSETFVRSCEEDPQEAEKLPLHSGAKVLFLGLFYQSNYLKVALKEIKQQ